jgi:hypothetical protein
VVWGLRDIVREWLKTLRERVFGAKPIVSVAAGLAAGRAEVHGYVDVDIGGTIDDQLTALKNQLSEVAKTVVTHDREIRSLTRETEERFEHERSERDKANSQIRDAIHANAPLEIAGAGLIALGILLSAVGSL